MRFNFFPFAFSLLGLATVAHAHMRLSSPVPFKAGDPDNGPLGGGGGNFPCKSSIFNYEITAMNTIPVNEPVLLGFKGSAVHGGGTCQLSISLDEEPGESSVFKVIQTFEGGCPVPGESGGFTFNIPKDFPSTERATLAWTWVSKLSGTQEFYMDCAPIKITGGADNKDYFDSLPDMFKANIPDSQCKTVLNFDPEVPVPGRFVLSSQDVLLKAPTGECGAPSTNNKKADTVSNLAAYTPPAKDSNQIEYVGGAGGSASGASPTAVPNGGYSGSGSGSGSGNAGSGNSGGAQSYDDGQYRPSEPTSQPASSPAVSSPAANPPAASSPAASSPVASSPAASSPVASSPAPSSPAAPSSYAPPLDQLPSSTLQTTLQTSTSKAAGTSASAPPYPYPTMSPTGGAGIAQPSGVASPSGVSSPSGSSSNSNTSGATGTCSEDGAVVCNGSDQFGLCDHGKVVWQTVASGTTCNSGVVEKRALNRRHAHVGRHARGLRL
ncbi:hypothetical protein Q7P37_001367 [Cladosporium fusiforme]